MDALPDELVRHIAKQLDVPCRTDGLQLLVLKQWALIRLALRLVTAARTNHTQLRHQHHVVTAEHVGEQSGGGCSVRVVGALEIEGVREVLFDL